MQMKRNAELIRKVADKIAAEPETYDQTDWARYDPICGTTCCVAGHAMLESGLYYLSRGRGEGVLGKFCYIEFITHSGSRFIGQYDRTAQALLGLTADEADKLFSSSWEPCGVGPLEERVQKALYALADGAHIEDITAEA